MEEDYSSINIDDVNIKENEGVNQLKENIVHWNLK